MLRLKAASLLALLFLSFAASQEQPRRPHLPQQPSDKPQGQAPAAEPKAVAVKATPPERIKMAKDFKVELLYSVPREKEGSWVSICALPDGRLIVSDQAGRQGLGADGLVNAKSVHVSASSIGDRP